MAVVALEIQAEVRPAEKSTGWRTALQVTKKTQETTGKRDNEVPKEVPILPWSLIMTTEYISGSFCKVSRAPNNIVCNATSRRRVVRYYFARDVES